MALYTVRNDIPDTGLPLIAADRLLMDDEYRCVKWLADFRRPDCYAGATPVADNALVTNLARLLNDAEGSIPGGRFEVAAGQTLAFADGGVDFSSITANNTYIEGPATACAAIKANSEYYAFCVYVTLPSEADWTTALTLRPFMSTNTNGSGYAAVTDAFSFGMQIAAGSPYLYHQRQVTLSPLTTSPNALLMPASAFGAFAQIGGYRDATGQRLILRTAAGVSLSTLTATGANNATDFSSNKIISGIHGLWAATGGAGTSAVNWKMHRQWVAATGLGPWDAEAKLAEDWDRTFAAYNEGMYN